jgi:hypothetical protein
VIRPFNDLSKFTELTKNSDFLEKVGQFIVVLKSRTMRNVFSFHNFGEYVRLEKYQKWYGFLVLGFKPSSPSPNFLKLSRVHKTSRKNIFVSLNFL